MKIKCCMCENIAVWFYMPGRTDGDIKNDFLCNDHIHRGCSCNIDPNTLVEDTDDKGRLLPCCEYDYDEEGYEESDFIHKDELDDFTYQN